MDNIKEVYHNGLCTGCGTCSAICPSNAIEIIKDDGKGIYIPQVNVEICGQCGLCLKVCPGHSVNFRELNLEIFGKEPENILIGNYSKNYIGHATDHEIRYNSSSGGLVTALLIFALEEGIIDGALVTKMSKQNPLEPEVFIARTQEEIISAAGSKYCPVPTNVGLNTILDEDGKFAVVGLPCHIQGIRKLENINNNLRDKIVFHLGIFCANTVAFLGTEYFLRKYGIKKEDILDLKYRGKGWPGMIVVSLKDGTERTIPRGTSEKSFSRKIHYSSSFHFDFMPPRCLLCCDQTCILSDISFGDPWLREVLNEEKTGKSIIISRNTIGDELLQKALKNRKIVLNELSEVKLLKAQNYAFKANYNSRRFVLKSLGKPVPIYNIEPAKLNHINCLSMLSYFPSYLSSNKYAWNFIYANAYIRSHIKRSFTILNYVLSFRSRK